MKLTPGMQQYMDIKNQHPDCIVLFRMGDFYETFYEDAKTAARVLGIALTSRGKGDSQAPLAGIPFHALDQYLGKLIKQGYKVALVEQLEDPKKAKGLVKRGVVRIVTPGTVMESYILDDKSNNYIMSVAKENSDFGVTIADISTGEFVTTTVSGYEKLINEITRFSPSEIIIPLSQETSSLFEKFPTTPYDDRHFWYEKAHKELLTHFDVLNLEGFGIEDKTLSVNASGALISYLKETQKTTLSHINVIKTFSHDEFMILDSSTLRNLEVVKNIRDGSTKWTLLETLDETITPMGSRLLRKWIQRPLLSPDEIKERQEAVGGFCASAMLREDVKRVLTPISNVERLISKVIYGSANARDLLSLRQSLLQIPLIKRLLCESSSALLRSIAELHELSDITTLIGEAINPEAPLSVREGKIIKQGYHADLDELRGVSQNAKQFIAQLEEKERERTGIKSLKIKFNKVFGYFIEVTKANLHLVPQEYIRKQTQVNSERFITQELKEKESLILGAEEKSVALEYELFMTVVAKISEYTTQIQHVAKKIGEVDTLYSLATVATLHSYVCPTVTDGSDIVIVDGRHPVIERIEEMFVPNNTTLAKENLFHIISGPNMAGKSTVMRQVALITLMAQIGSFVPATEAKIGVVDRIFTRVGAHDDLTHGQSTFMVEMNETANILNNATRRSLVILDEIGRGTSTFDGISIAWAVTEYLHNVGCKTMFATHYHQLNALADMHEHIQNYNIAITETDDGITFLHQVVSGGTDKSYGIQVAKLAGVPENVITRSKEIMHSLESGDVIKGTISSDGVEGELRTKASEPAVRDEGQKSLLDL